MEGAVLRFYVSEFKKHGGMLLHEWLFKKAKEIGIKGGAVFRTVAGFGRHGLHEEHFFELGSELPVEIVFYVEEAESKKLLAILEAEKLDLFYSKEKAEFGILKYTQTT